MANLDRDSVRAEFDRIRKSIPEHPPAAHVAATAAVNLLQHFLNGFDVIVEASKPNIVLAEAPELSEAAIRDLFAKPATVADPIPDGKAQRLATELTKLCAAETEGRFFDTVTDNIATIILALNAYNPPPEPGSGSLMSQPREGTKPFKGPTDETGQYRTPANGA